jgi:hypothetical protein
MMRTISADNAANRLSSGGSGGLAVIDIGTSRKIADIRLSVHPKDFNLTQAARVFLSMFQRRRVSPLSTENPGGKPPTGR